MPDRRLAAILAADLVGYSALMGADHDRTLVALRQLRAEVFGPAVAGHNGKVIKSMGDGWLVEFASAVDAVTCAMQVQDRLAGHEVIRLRIGVHIGDVVHEDEDVFGDGVNVAARLETLAEPGAVMVSDAVFGSLDGTLRPSFDDQGERRLKNIDRPVRIWARGGAVAQAGDPRPGPAIPRLAIVPVATSESREDVRELAAALTGDLATYLDAPDWLSTTTAGDPVPGAFVFETSLRARGERIRLDARLAGPDGAALWSGKFDGTLADSFDWQDETGEEAAARVLARVLDHEKQRLAAKSIDEMSAEECYLNGHLWLELVDRESTRRVLRFYAAAIDKDPEFTKAYSAAIIWYHCARTMGLVDITAEFADAFQMWLDAAEPLAATDPMLELYVAIATRTLVTGETRLRRAVQSALRQLPFTPDAMLFCGCALVWIGDPTPALECLRACHKLHRFTPWAVSQLGFWGLAAVMAGHDDEAVEVAEEGLRRSAGFSTLHRVLASAHANAGRLDEARAAIDKVLELLPTENLAFGRARSAYPDKPGPNRYFEGLRLAGLPAGEP